MRPDRDLFGPMVATLPPDGDTGRQERGAYYTPDALALAICRTLRDALGVHPHRTVFEPGCGGGAFLRAAASTWPNLVELPLLVGVDLAPACTGPGTVVVADLFEVGDLARQLQLAGYGLILGNPDYAIAEKVVRHCMTLLAPGACLAFLLRAAFLGSEGRVALFREHPLRALQPIAQRPSFTGGGSDPMEYALFVWQQGHAGRGELLPPLVWR